MQKYEVVRTDTADEGIRRIILYVAQNFGAEVALKKLNDIEKSILALGENPYAGVDPRYLVLKRLVFYKINEGRRKVIVYAVVDQRQDYLNIILGL